MAQLLDDNGFTGVPDDNALTYISDDNGNWLGSNGEQPSPEPPTAPTIAIISPINGALIKGNASVNIFVQANMSGTINILADGNLLKSTSNATTSSVTWSGKAITSGSHTIVATIDANEMQASASVMIQKK